MLRRWFSLAFGLRLGPEELILRPLDLDSHYTSVPLGLQLSDYRSWDFAVSITMGMNPFVQMQKL